MIIKRITSPSRKRTGDRPSGPVIAPRRNGEPVTIIVDPSMNLSKRIADGRRAWRMLWQRESFDAEWFREWKRFIPRGCSCAQDAADLLTQCPPRFETPDEWFAWKHEFHNLVNSKLAKPTLSIDRARMLWEHRRPDTGRTRCIVTVAHGAEFVDLLRITRPLMQAYADRCDADLIDLDNDTRDTWQLEKFRTWDFANQYDETLFLDVDCLVRPDAPNLFEVYADAQVAIHDDRPFLTRTDWLTTERENVSKLVGEFIADAPICLNSGVVYCKRSAADIWKPPPAPLGETHCCEQIWVEHQSRAFTVTPMDSRFNWQWYFRKWADGVPDAWIVHLANYANKPALAMQFVNEWNSKKWIPLPALA